MVTRLPLQLTTLRKDPGRSFLLPTETQDWHKPLGESLRRCGRPPPADLRRHTLHASNASRKHLNTGCHSRYVQERPSTQPFGTQTTVRTQPIPEPSQHAAIRCTD